MLTLITQHIYSIMPIEGFYHLAFYRVSFRCIPMRLHAVIDPKRRVSSIGKWEISSGVIIAPSDRNASLGFQVIQTEIKTRLKSSSFLGDMVIKLLGYLYQNVATWLK